MELYCSSIFLLKKSENKVGYEKATVYLMELFGSLVTWVRILWISCSHGLKTKLFAFEYLFDCVYKCYLIFYLGCMFALSISLNTDTRKIEYFRQRGSCNFAVNFVVSFAVYFFVKTYVNFISALLKTNTLVLRDCFDYATIASK